MSTFHDVEGISKARKSIKNWLAGGTRQEDALQQAFWRPSGRQKEPKGGQVGAKREPSRAKMATKRHAK